MKLISLFLALLGVYSCSIETAQSNEQKLIGSWDLVTWKALKDDGSVVFPYGKDARGMLIYTADKTAVLSLSKNNRPRLGSDDYQHMSRDTLLEAYSGFFSYHGTYSIDKETQTVSHFVEACKIPDWEMED